THGHARLGSTNNFLVAAARMLCRFPVATLRAEHRNGTAATHQSRVVGRDLERGTVPELDHLARGTRHLRCQQRRAPQTFAVAPTDRRLLLVRAKQDPHRLLTCADVLAPVGAQRSAPDRAGAEEPVFPATSPAKQDQATHRLARDELAPSALL